MKKHLPIYAFSLVALVVLPVVSIAVGRYSISIVDVFSALMGSCEDAVINTVVFNLRLPRIVTALLVGASLSCAGTAYQGVFQNPLVSPDLLGVSSGSCVGAALAILLGLGSGTTVAVAFFSGLLCVVLTVFFSNIVGKKSNLVLILAGVIVGKFMDSIFGGIKYFADAENELSEIVYWQMGSVAKVTMERIAYVIPIILISLLAMFLLRWRVNLLSIGERDAQSLGVNLSLEKGLIIVFSTILTAASVSVSGSIGWIGLIIPHISRWLIGSDNKHAIPLSMLLGAIFLLVVDTLARTLTPLELPLSVLTGIIGTPIFAVILVKQRRKS